MQTVDILHFLKQSCSYIINFLRSGHLLKISMCHDATTRALIEFHALSGAGIITSSMSGKSKKSYWQGFSYAGDSTYEAFFHLGSVPLESTVADALQ